MSAIVSYQTYDDLVSKSSLDRAIGLNNLAHAIDRGYKNSGTGLKTNLDEAPEIIQEANQIADKIYPKMISIRGEMMTKLGNTKTDHDHTVKQIAYAYASDDSRH